MDNKTLVKILAGTFGASLLLVGADVDSALFFTLIGLVMLIATPVVAFRLCNNEETKLVGIVYGVSFAFFVLQVVGQTDGIWNTIIWLTSLVGLYKLWDLKDVKNVINK